MNQIKDLLNSVLMKAKGDRRGIRSLIMVLEEALAKAKALEFQAVQVEWQDKNGRSH